ncbi:hypothetical protein LXA43DRAFT_593032 [Ganoderma leucocontextum]|nr:hypothetical protein LXA43DRAFT_593032 [Ganoderma leucocontextum]
MRLTTSQSSPQAACQCGAQSGPLLPLLIPPDLWFPPPSGPTSIFPHPRRFGVVQMDPVAMVTTAGLGDSIALEEAKALVTKKYLVYLDFIIGLPMPDSEWCRYNVLPVATTLRPENPELGITRDMVLPIHPNTAHLVVPSPFICKQDPAHTFEFMFKNCFLWVESHTVLCLRVRRDNDEYNNSKAVSLNLRQHYRAINSFGPHLDRMVDHFEEHPQNQPTLTSTAARAGTPSMPPQPDFDAMMGRLPVVLDADNTEGGGPDREARDTEDGGPDREAHVTEDGGPDRDDKSSSLSSLPGWVPYSATKYTSNELLARARGAPQRDHNSEPCRVVDGAAENRRVRLSTMQLRGTTLQLRGAMPKELQPSLHRRSPLPRSQLMRPASHPRSQVRES